VTSNTRQVLALTISLVLLGLLSGCVVGGVLVLATGQYAVSELAGRAIEHAVVAAATKPRDPYSYVTGKNHYEPVILTSNEDMIRIKYLSVGPNAEHEQVTQLISDHCHGAYIETSRVELRGYDTVEAECTHVTESLQ
jgi:hypothetical protein